VHPYANEGSYAIGVKITDDGGSSTSATSTATVADAALTAAGVIVSATEGTSTGNATVATFTDANPNATASDFAAAINWGDGTTSTGTISANGNGGFAVTGVHTYVDEGKYTVGVKITDDGGSTANTTSTATVADADVQTGQGTNLAANVNQLLANVVVASFKDTYVGNVASDFTATINWGDGTSTAGAVSGGNGAFTVSGSHAYAKVSEDVVTVTLADDALGTATATAISSALIGAPPDGFVPGIPGQSAGFWAQHLLDWNGIANDDPKASNLVASGVLSSTDVLYTLPTHGLDLDGSPQSNPYYGQLGGLLGDANGDGRTDNGETTLFIPLAAAQQLINSSDSSLDARQILMKQAITAQLNIDNGDKDPGLYPGQSAGHDLIEEAVKWLTGQAPFTYSDGRTGNVDTNHDGILEINGLGSSGIEYNTTLAAFSSPALASSEQAWQAYVDPIHSPPQTGDIMVNGQDVKNALQAFNLNQLITSMAGFHVGWNNNGTVNDVHANTADTFLDRACGQSR
jgi:hypothetical protein